MMQVNEYSLPDILLTTPLPVSVRISRQYVINKKTVLKTGQFVTVLDCQQCQVLQGVDWNGNRISINGERCKNLFVNVVEEFFPQEQIEFANLSNRIDLIILKNNLSYQSWLLQAGESFSMKDTDVSHLIGRQGESGKEIILVREKDNQDISIPVIALLNGKLFSYAKIKEQCKLDAIDSIEGKSIQFLTSTSYVNMALPHGIVNIQSAIPLEIISTVTFPAWSKYILYESYPLDTRIMCFIDTKLPKLISLLGGKESKDFKRKLEEIDFLSFYDSYSHRLYGYYMEENVHELADWELQMEEFVNKKIRGNPLFNTANNSRQNIHKLNVADSTLKKLSRNLSFKQSIGNITSAYPEKVIRFWRRRKIGTKYDDDTLIKNLSLSECDYTSEGNNIVMSYDAPGQEFESSSYESPNDLNESLSSSIDAENPQSQILHSVNPLFAEEPFSNDTTMRLNYNSNKPYILERTNPLYEKTNLDEEGVYLTPTDESLYEQPSYCIISENPMNMTLQERHFCNDEEKPMRCPSDITESKSLETYNKKTIHNLIVFDKKSFHYIEENVESAENQSSEINSGKKHLNKKRLTEENANIMEDNSPIYECPLPNENVSGGDEHAANDNTNITGSDQNVFYQNHVSRISRLSSRNVKREHIYEDVK